MILMTYRIPAGNAIRLILSPPRGAESIRLLRKDSDTFIGESDSGAVVVYDGSPQDAVLDWHGLVNGQEYFYRLFSLVDGDWIASASVSGTPAMEEEDFSVDVLSIVRERLELGLAAEVASGLLRHKNGRIPVLTAPPLTDNAVWPLVTVHVASDSSSVRGIGEAIAIDRFLSDDWAWDVSDGWLSQWSILIVGWSLNPDERILLRKTIKRIVIGNLPVFDDAGMVQVDFQQQDVEDFDNYNVPVYEVVGTLGCLAPSLAVVQDPAITDVQVDAEVVPASLTFSQSQI